MYTARSHRVWLPDKTRPYNMDMRVNAHLGAGGAMTQGIVQDPEVAKIFVISFKTTTGAARTI